MGTTCVIRYRYTNDNSLEPYKANKISLGCSDMACLIVRSGSQLEFLHFGQDDCYDAWYVDKKDVEIPDHYKLKIKTSNWLSIYDDDELVFNEKGDFEIYRAGEVGCIIRKV